MIRYKVVNKNRGSCVVPPQYRKYYRKYLKDHTVYAPKGSFGLATFKTEAFARRFTKKQRTAGVQTDGYKIIRVRPIGRALKRPKGILCILGKSITILYRCLEQKEHVDWGIIPPGTLFYRAVKVLD